MVGDRLRTEDHTLASPFGTLTVLLLDSARDDLARLRQDRQPTAPPMTPRDKARVPSERMKGDTDAVVAWRPRMEGEAAKTIYRERAATIECVNAQIRNRGLRQFLVRGLDKARAVALWHALAHNLRITMTLLQPVEVTA